MSIESEKAHIWKCDQDNLELQAVALPRAEFKANHIHIEIMYKRANDYITEAIGVSVK